MKVKKTIFNLLLILLLLGLATPVIAGQSIFDAMSGGVRTAIDNAYGGGESVTISQSSFLGGLLMVLNILLTFIGIAFFVLLLYAGYLWMTARGNDEILTKAKKITREVIIGLIIILLARIITEFLLTAVGQVIESTTPVGT